MSGIVAVVATVVAGAAGLSVAACCAVKQLVVGTAASPSLFVVVQPAVALPLT